MNQIQQNATQVEPVLEVAVTDPQHPLFGQTLVVISEKSSKGQQYLTLRLASGQHRAVLRSATNMEGEKPPPDLNRPLMPISARTILPLARFIRSKLQTLEENSHVASIETGGSPARGSADPVEDPTLHAVAPIESGRAPADGSPVGEDDAENAPGESGSEG